MLPRTANAMRRVVSKIFFHLFWPKLQGSNPHSTVVSFVGRFFVVWLFNVILYILLTIQNEPDLGINDDALDLYT
jgi:hypothetical protein